MQSTGDKPSVEPALLQEYLALQKAVEEYDARALTIKGWSVTLSMAGVGAGVLEDNYIIAALAALTAGLFWVIETLWKSFQYNFYERIQAIEAHMRGEEETVPLQISAAWRASFYDKPTARFFMIGGWPHVFLPHILVLLVGLAAAGLLAAG